MCGFERLDLEDFGDVAFSAEIVMHSRERVCAFEYISGTRHCRSFCVRESVLQCVAVCVFVYRPDMSQCRSICVRESVLQCAVVCCSVCNCGQT